MIAVGTRRTLRKPNFWRLSLAGVVAGLLLLAPLPGTEATLARAIDPTRKLAQCLHRIWQAQQGLPQATIYAICQTTDGYLWLGTSTGLCRFDGAMFIQQELAAPASPKSRILSLAEGQGGELWVGTDGAGLLRIRNGTCEAVTQVQATTILSLLVDRQGAVWAGTLRGVTRVDALEAANFTHSDGLPFEAARAIAQLPDQSIWIAGDGPVISVHVGKNCTQRRLDSLPESVAIRAILPGADGTVWLGTSIGVLQLQGTAERLLTTAEGLADNDVYCLAAGSHGGAWVGTRQGFSRVQGEELDSFRPRDGLSQSTVYAICEDQEGSIWVGTKHGLNQFADRRTIPFTTREGLPSNDVGPILQDDQGLIWVGTLDAGLARYDGKKFTSVRIDEGLASNTIQALAQGAPDELWVGTDQGLNRLSGGHVTDTFTVEQGLPDDSIRCLLHHGELWAGTAAGLAVLRNGEFVLPPSLPPELRGGIAAMAVYRDQLLIAASDANELYVLDHENFRPLGGFLPARGPNALFVDGQGLLWVGMRSAGLLLVDGARSYLFTPAEGLYDDEIFGILADPQDRLWLACSKGIFSVQRSELLQVAAGQLKQFASMPFSPTEGQRTIECRGGVQPAVWRMRDDRLWFATIHGMIVVDPNGLVRKLPLAPVVVDAVIVDGTPRSKTELDQLPRGANNVSFRYAALSFRSPTRITYRYRLEGFDDDWIEAGTRREAFYTNLPPGTYRFRVAARNVDDQISELRQPIELTIRPRLYQARWFLPSCLLVVAAAAWFAYRWRVRWIKSRLQAVVTERSRIARELHDTLMQGFSGITMEMQALLARLPASDDRDSLEDIVGDAGMCLREARRSIAGLRMRDAESGLGPSVAQAALQLAETADIRLRLHIAKQLPRLAPDVEYNLLRIAQEALANTSKHADATLIEIWIDCHRDVLRLAIRDDGRGFVPVAAPDANSEHYGLLGMRERAAQIGARLNIDSQPGQGATIEITLATRRADTKAAPTAVPIED